MSRKSPNLDDHLVELLFDDELPPAEAEALRAALAADPEASERFQAWQHVLQMTAELPEAEPDPQVHYEILRAARTAAAEHGKKKGLWAWIEGLLSSPALATAGLLVVAAGSAFFVGRMSDQAPEAGSSVAIERKADAPTQARAPGGKLETLTPAPKGAPAKVTAEAKTTAKDAPQRAPAEQRFAYDEGAIAEAPALTGALEEDKGKEAPTAKTAEKAPPPKAPTEDPTSYRWDANEVAGGAALGRAAGAVSDEEISSKNAAPEPDLKRGYTTFGDAGGGELQNRKSKGKGGGGKDALDDTVINTGGLQIDPPADAQPSAAKVAKAAKAAKKEPKASSRSLNKKKRRARGKRSKLTDVASNRGNGPLSAEGRSAPARRERAKAAQARKDERAARGEREAEAGDLFAQAPGAPAPSADRATPQGSPAPFPGQESAEGVDQLFAAEPEPEPDPAPEPEPVAAAPEPVLSPVAAPPPAAKPSTTIAGGDIGGLMGAGSAGSSSGSQLGGLLNDDVDLAASDVSDAREPSRDDGERARGEQPAVEEVGAPETEASLKLDSANSKAPTREARPRKGRRRAGAAEAERPVMAGTLVEGREARARGAYSQAIKAFSAYIDANAERGIPLGQVYLETAETYEALGDLPRAMQMYRLAARQGGAVAVKARQKLKRLEARRSGPQGAAKAAPTSAPEFDEVQQQAEPTRE